MTRKKTSLGQAGLAGTLFTNINPYEQPGKGTPPPITETFPISEIHPDPNQPRQILPAHLASQFAKGELTPTQAMADWLTTPEAKTSSELVNLRKLAESIEQHGLINPITIRPKDTDEAVQPETKYVIVTGERRYWAHIYLAHHKKKIHDGEETQTPDRIKAGVTRKGISIRAHQLLENILREDINAVEKARGFWALRYELSGVNHGSPSADKSGTVKLVPWSQVEKSLGISKRYRTYITAVLNLCDDALALVAEHDLRERMIRPITQKLKQHPQLQVAALEKLITWQSELETEDGQKSSLTTAVDELADSLLQQLEPVGKSEVATAQQKKTPTLQFHRKIRGALRLLEKLDDTDLSSLTQELIAEENADIVSEIRDLREQLNTLLNAVSKDSSSSGR